MAYDIAGSVARGLTLAIIPIVFALARKYWAPSADSAFEVYSIDELDRRFSNAKWLANTAMLAIGIAMGWVTHASLVALNRFFAKQDGGEIILFPQSATWFFLPFFAALTLSWELMLRIWSAIDQKEAALYNYWTITKAGYDSTRLLRLFAVLIVLPIGVLTALEIPSHVSLRAEDILARGFGFGGVETYRYADARRMTLINGFRNRDGKLESRAGVVLDFSDGRRWSSASIGEFKSMVDPNLVNFIQRKTNLAPQFAEAESDVPRIPRQK
jgi:hypothetical protein